MDFDIIITTPAEKDLSDLLDYIGSVLCNKPAAESFLEDFSENLDHLSQMPFLYSECNDAVLNAKGYRKIAVGNYIVLYKVDAEMHRVYISRVVYGRRNLPDMVDEKTPQYL